MSELEVGTNPYTGPSMGDPRAKLIGTFDGLLSAQGPEFQDAVASMRAGHVSRSPGYAPMPYTIELIMLDGTQIQSETNSGSDSINFITGECQIVLSRWNRSELEWCTLKISGDAMKLTVFRNPPDPQQSWRPTKLTITPPTSA